MSAYEAPSRHDHSRVTIDEFLRLPEEEEYRLELVDGYVVREPRPGGRHGAVTSRIASALHTQVRDAAAATVFTDTGFLLSREPRIVRGPDVAVVSHDRLAPSDIPVGIVELAPDLAVEVASPANTAEGMQAKVGDYLDAGTPVVWVVYPARREVVVYNSRTDIRIAGAPGHLTAEDVLPGIRVDIAGLFSP